MDSERSRQLSSMTVRMRVVGAIAGMVLAGMCTLAACRGLRVAQPVAVYASALDGGAPAWSAEPGAVRFEAVANVFAADSVQARQVMEVLCRGQTLNLENDGWHCSCTLEEDSRASVVLRGRKWGHAFYLLQGTVQRPEAVLVDAPHSCGWEEGDRTFQRTVVVHRGLGDAWEIASERDEPLGECVGTSTAADGLICHSTRCEDCMPASDVTQRHRWQRSGGKDGLVVEPIFHWTDDALGLEACPSAEDAEQSHFVRLYVDRIDAQQSAAALTLTVEVHVEYVCGDLSRCKHCLAHMRPNYALRFQQHGGAWQLVGTLPEELKRFRPAIGE